MGVDRTERIELEHEFLDAAKAFSWDTVKTMLRETPDLINVQPCGRWTALHQAAYEGNADMAKELLALGASSSAMTRAGKSPLEVAKGGAKEALAAAAPPAEAAAAAGETVASPPKKRAKKAATPHTMNINGAVDQEYHHASFAEIASAPPSALLGIGKVGQETLKKLGVKSVRGLGRWKFYKMAKALKGLSSMEEKGARSEVSTLNADKALDKKHENKALADIADLPPSALQGLADWVDADFAKLHVKSIGDLATWKFAQWAEWITDLADFEEGPAKE